MELFCLLHPYAYPKEQISISSFLKNLPAMPRRLRIVLLLLIGCTKLPLSAQMVENGEYVSACDRVVLSHDGIRFPDNDLHVASMPRYDILDYDNKPLVSSGMFGSDPSVYSFKANKQRYPAKLRIRMTIDDYRVHQKRYLEETIDLNQETLFVSDQELDIYISSYPQLYVRTYFTLLPYYLDFDYVPSSLNNTGVFYLPSDDEATLQATKNFIPIAYNWQYQHIDRSGHSEWKNFKENLSYKERTSFCGYQLFSPEEFDKLLEQNHKVSIRINTPRHQINQEKLDLVPILSSPHIIQTEAMAPTCHGEGNGSIRLTFDRALRQGEKLNIYRDGLLLESEGGNIQLDKTNSVTLRGLPHGSYTLTLRGSYLGYDTYTLGEKHKVSVTVPELAPLAYTEVTSKNISCHQGNDGSITLRPSGGSGHYVLKLFRGSSFIKEVQVSQGKNALFSRLSAGVYRIELHDTNGCQSKERPKTITLTEPQRPIKAELRLRQLPKGHGTSDGLLSIRVSGGTPDAQGYRVSWRDASGKIFNSTHVERDKDTYIYTLAHLKGGSYSVTVGDANYDLLSPEDKQSPCNCYTKLSLNLPAPPPLTVALKENRQLRCASGHDGELSATVAGGVPRTKGVPYTYAWYVVAPSGTKKLLRGETNSTLRNIGQGLYEAVVTDANGIEARSKTYHLTAPSPITIHFQTINPTCSSPNGSITAQVSGGIPPYSYRWLDSKETTPHRSGLPTGKYILIVSDAYGCSAEASAQLVAPPQLVVTPNVKHVSCYGQSDGSITLSLRGGTPPYTINWQDISSTTTTRSGLKAGSYKALITDTRGCSTSVTLTLREPRPITYTLTPAFTLCSGASRLLRVNSDDPSLTYKWYRDGKLLSKETSSTLRIKEAGSYRVTLTNSAGCSISEERIIHQGGQAPKLKIAVPTEVEVGSPIHAVNITKQWDGHIEWHLPEEATLLEEYPEGIIFSLNRTGYFTLSAVASFGDCVQEIAHSLRALPKGSIALPKETDIPLVRHFFVAPNPTTDIIHIHLELKEPTDIQLLLFSETGKLLSEERHNLFHRGELSLSLSQWTPGLYFLQLRLKGERSTIKLLRK